MSLGSDLLQMALYLGLLISLAAPLGAYMARVFAGERTRLDFLARPLERLVYRCTGVDPGEEMSWKTYACALLVFSGLGVVALFALQMAQGRLPWNPQGLPGVSPLLALSTAISFVTNTNWQAYPGETTVSYCTQMAGLAVQNFLSAATGITVALALTRGLARHSRDTIGNFWVDLTRSVLYVLLPLSVLLALILVSQGVIQNLHPYVHATGVEGGAQVLPMGPVASQEAIKQLGTNGGGSFNANSAHPFENPSPLTNLLEVLAILVIPAALTFTFGRMVGDRRQGWAILGAMVLLFVLALGSLYTAERAGNPLLSAQGVSAPTAMEGKEVRFGLAQSSLFATATTAASCGAVNTMHGSLTPLGGLVPLVQIMLGEVVFGGVGAGLYGMLVFVILTVFVVGLMVGRTPEYLGKKIGAREMKMAVVAVLLPSVGILLGAALAIASPSGLAGRANLGPHGLSEILYAASSGAGNNGSAFAGLNAALPFYLVLSSVLMLVGRFGVIVPVLAIAGSLAAKKTIPPGPGTFPTTGWLFVVMLAVMVLVIGALTFFPALSLGPIVEHLLMQAGERF